MANSSFDRSLPPQSHSSSQALPQVQPMVPVPPPQLNRLSPQLLSTQPLSAQATAPMGPVIPAAAPTDLPPPPPIQPRHSLALRFPWSGPEILTGTGWLALITLGIVETTGRMIIPRWSWLLAVAGASAGTGAMVTRQLTRRQLQPLHTQVTALETFGQTHLHLAPPAPVSADLASAYPTLTTLESKLRHILAQMGGQMEQLNLRHQQEQKQQTLFNALSFRIRQTPQTQVLFQTAVTGAQQILGCDRVVIYRFNRDWSGTVVAESVSPGFVTLLQEWIDDSCFTQDTDPYAKAYQEGRIRAINDIYTEPNLSPCYLQMLEQYQVRANLVVPIRDNHQLTGFLIAQTCAKPRQWQPEDLSFLSHLATELEYKLDYLNYIQAQEAAAQRSWLFNEIAFRARQFLNLDDIFQTTVQGTREILKADRVLIYRFNPTWVGTMVAESVGPEFVQVLDENIDDPCFRGRYVELYREGRVRAINDIYH